MMDMKKMINVQEAYEESLKNREMNNAKVLDEIEERILEAIKKGSFEIYFKSKEELYFGAGVVEDLHSRGFKVKIISPDMDEYGRMYPGYIKISWKHGKEKADWKTRFKARIAAFFN